MAFLQGFNLNFKHSTTSYLQDTFVILTIMIALDFTTLYEFINKKKYNELHISFTIRLIRISRLFLPALFPNYALQDICDKLKHIPNLFK